MSVSAEDIEAYGVGLVLVLGLYGIMFKLLPAAYRLVRPVAKSAVQLPLHATTTPRSMAVFPYPVREVKASEAMSAYEAAKKSDQGIPVIIGGGAEEVEKLATFMAQTPETAADYLRRAAENPDPFATTWKPIMPKSWPAAGPYKDSNPSLLYFYDKGLRLKDTVALAIVPATASWQIPAYLKLGGWNEHADSDIKVAALLKWHKAYGAELVAVTFDGMDIRVARRPATREEAMALAYEHYNFSETNNTPLAEIAAELMTSDWWHFWWD